MRHRSVPGRRVLATVAALVLLLAACGGDSDVVAPDSDGWVAVDEGQSRGSWVLYAQLTDDGSWNGCLRLDHADARISRCTEPDGPAVVFGNAVLNFGAAPSGSALVDGSGEEIVLHDGGHDLGVGFFVAPREVVDSETGDPVPVAGAEEDLEVNVVAFVGTWRPTDEVDCDAEGVAPTLSTLEITTSEVSTTSPCGDGGAEVTCSASYVLVGGERDGAEMSSTLRPVGLDCDAGAQPFDGLRLDVDVDASRLVVDGSTEFESS